MTLQGWATKEVGCGGPGGTFQNARWVVEEQRVAELRCVPLPFPLSGAGPLTGESRPLGLPRSRRAGLDTRQPGKPQPEEAVGPAWAGDCGFPEPGSVFGRLPGMPGALPARTPRGGPRPRPIRRPP